jgi:hypothetical protein
LAPVTWGAALIGDFAVILFDRDRGTTPLHWFHWLLPFAPMIRLGHARGRLAFVIPALVLVQTSVVRIGQVLFAGGSGSKRRKSVGSSLYIEMRVRK